MRRGFGWHIAAGCFGAAVFANAAATTIPAFAQATPVRAQPVKPEKNPPGDIPDDQVFIRYRSPLGYSIKVPEGWARREEAHTVTFNDKYDIVRIDVGDRREPPTASTIKQTDVPELEKTGKAVRVSAVKEVKLASSGAVIVSYASNSEPNAVTNKAIRLENERYYFWKSGKLAMLTMSAPFGADNADQWQLMAKSFRWD